MDINEILNPKSTWSNPNEWESVAQNLAQQFIKNFQQFTYYLSTFAKIKRYVS